MYTNEFQTVEYQGSILLGEGGGEDLSPKLSSFPPPQKKIANELLFPEPRVSGCTKWLRLGINMPVY